MHDAVVWWPAIVTAIAAALTGIALMAANRGAKRSTKEGADLEAAVNRVARSLQEEVDTGREPAERARLERELADLLGRLDRASLSMPDPEPVAEHSVSQTRSFITGVVVTLVLVGLALATWNAMSPRREGEGVTGSIPESGGSPAVPDTRLTELRMAVGSNPDDVGARLALAQALMERRDLVGVFEQTQQILQREPEQPRALGLEAVVRMAMGQTAAAIEMLERSSELDPSDLETRIHLAIALVQTGQTERALSIVDQAISDHPQESTMLRQLRDEIARIGRENAPSPGPPS